MVVCRFFLQGNCKFGENCRNEHPRDNRNQNRFGALQGGNDRRRNDPQREDWQISIEQVKIDLKSGRDGRPVWILSSYGPGRDAPASLLQDNEFSPEEVRARFYEFAQNGKQDEADREAIALWSKADQSMNEVLSKADDIVNFMRTAAQKHPNREDLTQMDGTKSREQFEKEYAEQSGAQNSGIGSSSSPNPFSSGNTTSALGGGLYGFAGGATPHQHSPFGQKNDNPFAKPAAATFGQPSQPSSSFGQPAFGSSGFGGGGAAAPAASASNPFAKPAAATFGQPSAASAFGQPSQPGSAFGQPAFGSTGFGQSSNPNPFARPAAAAFGQPSQPASTFGQPSQPTSTFGQPSQPSSGFGQPSQPSAFGQPSQPASAFGQPSQPGAFGASSSPFGQAKTAFGQPSSSSSPFGQNASSASPFGQAASTTSPFGQQASTASPFGQPAQPSGFTPSNPFAAAARTEEANDIAMDPTSPVPAPAQRPNPFGAAPAQPSPFAAAANAPSQSQPAFIPGTVTQSNLAAAQPIVTSNMRALHYTQTLPQGPPQFSGDQLTSFRGQPVSYVTITPGYVRPCYRRPDGRGLEQVWFPRGQEERDVAALAAKMDDLMGAKDAYTDEVRAQYAHLVEHGAFRDGVVPMVPPAREIVAYDF